MPSKSKRSKARAAAASDAAIEVSPAIPQAPMSISSDVTATTAAPPAEADKGKKRKAKRKRSSTGAHNEGSKDTERKRKRIGANPPIATDLPPAIAQTHCQHEHDHLSDSRHPPVSVPTSVKPDRTAVLEARIAELEAQVGAYAEVASCETNMIGGIQEDVTCDICCAPLWRPHTLVPCGHVFCLGCLVAWFHQSRPSDANTHGLLLDQHKHCPRCRTKLTHAPVELWIPKSINERLDSGGTRLRQLYAAHSVQLDRLPHLGDGVGTHTTETDPSEPPRVLTEAERDAQAGLTDRLLAAQTRSHGKAVGVFYDIFRDNEGTSKLSWDSADDIWRCQLCHSEVAYWTCSSCGHRFTHDDLPETYPSTALYELDEWGDEGLSDTDGSRPDVAPPTTSRRSPYRNLLAQADWRIVNVLMVLLANGHLEPQMDRTLLENIIELVRKRRSAYSSPNSQEQLRSLTEKLDAFDSLYGELPPTSGVYPGPADADGSNRAPEVGFVRSLLDSGNQPHQIDDGPESLPSSSEHPSDADSDGNLAGFIESDDGEFSSSEDGSFRAGAGPDEEDLPIDDRMSFSARARGDTPQPVALTESDEDAEMASSDNGEGSPPRIELNSSPSSDHVTHSRRTRTSAVNPSRRAGRAGRTRSRAQIVDSDEDGA